MAHFVDGDVEALVVHPGLLDARAQMRLGLAHRRRPSRVRNRAPDRRRCFRPRSSPSPERNQVSSAAPGCPFDTLSRSDISSRPWRRAPPRVYFDSGPESVVPDVERFERTSQPFLDQRATAAPGAKRAPARTSFARALPVSGGPHRSAGRSAWAQSANTDRQASRPGTLQAAADSACSAPARSARMPSCREQARSRNLLPPQASPRW